MKKLFSILLLTALLTFAFTGCGLQVPRPEIKKADFAFSVTYEMNGETKTVSGVLVCEYDGTSWSLDGGYRRAWKGTITGVESDIGYETRIGTTEDGGDIIIAYGFNPNYFMGDNGYAETPAPWLTVSYPFEDGSGGEFIYDADIIEEEYGVRIVSYEYAAPIKNSFSLFNL